MKKGHIESAELQALSRLFSFPEQWPDGATLDRRSHASENQKIAEIADIAGTDLLALQNAYVSLFINALPEVPCPPYGSYYIEGVLMGETTVRLGKMYREYGFQITEMADHIAVELEFLALLTVLLKQNDPVQEDHQFLLAHLRQWTPKFFSRVEQNDQTGFYSGVARNAGRILFREVTAPVL